MFHISLFQGFTEESYNTEKGSKVDAHDNKGFSNFFSDDSFFEDHFNIFKDIDDNFSKFKVSCAGVL